MDEQANNHTTVVKQNKTSTVPWPRCGNGGRRTPPCSTVPRSYISAGNARTCAVKGASQNRLRRTKLGGETSDGSPSPTRQGKGGIHPTKQRSEIATTNAPGATGRRGNMHGIERIRSPRRTNHSKTGRVGEEGVLPNPCFIFPASRRSGPPSTVTSWATSWPGKCVPPIPAVTVAAAAARGKGGVDGRDVERRKTEGPGGKMARYHMMEKAAKARLRFFSSFIGPEDERASACLHC